MKKYTIGILFTPDFQNVLLIQKNRPDWQKGRLNFPGGHIEEGETPRACIVREIKEETDLYIPADGWKYIGRIQSETYLVEVFTGVCDNMTLVQTMTDEIVSWYHIDPLPSNIISNIKWLVPFAVNVHNQGKNDALVFGQFEYKNI